MNKNINNLDLPNLPSSSSEDLNKMNCEVINTIIQENNDYEWDNVGVHLYDINNEPREVYVVNRKNEAPDNNRGAKRLRPAVWSPDKSSEEPINSELHKNEICITSLKEPLPKQIGLAKLLVQQDIKNITKIKYISPYKVIIHFENENDVTKLLNNQSMTDRGYFIKKMNEVNISYGVIKQIDLDITEQELKDNLECDFEIVGIKRLNRFSTGQWIGSESVRVGFKGNVLPSYIFGFGCRFKIEPFVFPVTQCSGCWKFGHIKRMCPSKKIICPKCGDNHDNCEIVGYTCPNCSGPHMALDRSCPIYIKEREIRSIMSKENCTYKKALSITREAKQSYSEAKDNTIEVALPSFSRAYRDVLMNKNRQASVPEGDSDSISEVSNNNYEVKDKKNKNKKKKPRLNINENKKAAPIKKEKSKENNSSSSLKNKYDLSSSFKRILKKIQEIILTNTKFEEKIKLIFNYLVGEITNYLIHSIQEGNILHKILNMFNGE